MTAGFVRPAPWLRRLFTPSQTSPVNPTRVSDDVSLTQPYDGSGWPLYDPGQWVILTQSAVGTPKTTVIETVPIDRICRLLAVAVILNAGVAPSCQLQAGVAITLSVGAPVVVHATEMSSVPSNTPIIGPGHSIRGRHYGGDAATQVTWYLYRVLAPIGTVFYV